MRIIFTEYRGPKHKTGARIAARLGDGARASIPDHGGLDDEARHRAAAEALIAKHRLRLRIVTSCRDHRGFCFFARMESGGAA